MKPYLKYFYEVIAIVVGITLSIMVDEWREQNQLEERKKEILSKILDRPKDSPFYQWEENFINKYTYLVSDSAMKNRSDSVTWLFYFLDELTEIKYNASGIDFQLLATFAPDRSVLMDYTSPENLDLRKLVNEKTLNLLSDYQRQVVNYHEINLANEPERQAILQLLSSENIISILSKYKNQSGDEKPVSFLSPQEIDKMLKLLENEEFNEIVRIVKFRQNDSISLLSNLLVIDKQLKESVRKELN